MKILFDPTVDHCGIGMKKLINNWNIDLMFKIIDKITEIYLGYFFEVIFH